MLCFVCAGADLLKLTREDVIQICGPADGIRLFNALKGRWVLSARSECSGLCSCVTQGLCVFTDWFLCDPHSVVRPRLTVYVCQESQREQQVKHENGDASANTFFGLYMPALNVCL